jgi:hypothetical protein
MEIARSFSHMHAIRHLASGGAFFYGDAPQTPCFAGRHVIDLLRDKRLANLMGMGSLFEDPTEHRMYRLMSREASQELSQAGDISDPTVDMDPDLRHCKAITLANGDVAKPGSFVLFRCDGDMRPGRVMSILAQQEQLHARGLLIEPYRVGPLVLPYRLHAAEKDARALASFVPLEVSSLLSAKSVRSLMHNRAYFASYTPPTTV